MNGMRTEGISRDRQRRFADLFDKEALTLLPGQQRALLQEWLKSDAQMRRWDTLLKAAVSKRIDVETAESLAEMLAGCGAAVLEERFEAPAWRPVALVWRDYEALCAALGLKTQAVQRAALAAAWFAAQEVDWQHAALAEAYQALANATAEKGQTRLSLLMSLNDWLREGNSGTRREFALFAREQTKQITKAEWTWLAAIVELADCGIERHAPSLWMAGDVQLQIGACWLDVGAAGDFIGLTPVTLSKLTHGKTAATHYRLIENRTSFENLARDALTVATAIVLWLPGYAPRWWRVAVGKLLDVLPLPARISCDADPDGVQIALNAAELWTTRGLAWETHAMSAEDAAGSRHKLPLTERDMRLAESLLERPALPPAMQTLLQWCIDHRCKAEQENWL